MNSELLLDKSAKSADSTSSSYLIR